MFGPLALAPFWVAAATWTGATAAAFAAASWRLLSRDRVAGLALILLSPAAVLAAVSGQTTLAVGAMVPAAVLLFARRPLLAGLLLGAAVMLKPTVLMALPIALIAGGHWRALAAACACAAALGLASAAVYGPGVWLDWIAAAPRFAAVLARDPTFNTGIIAPTGLAGGLGVSGGALMAVRLGFALTGFALAAWVFRRTDDASQRLTALLGGSLLAAPYAMTYEAALLAPGAVVMLLSAPRGPRGWQALAGFAALALAGLPGPGAGCLLLFLALTFAPFVAGRPRPVRT